MKGTSVGLSWHLGLAGVRSREAIVICGPTPRCGPRIQRLRFHEMPGLRSSAQSIALATPYSAFRHGRGRVSQVVYAGEDVEDRTQEEPLRQEAKTTPSPPKGEERWWDLTRYTTQERALLLGITLGLLLFGPRLVIFLIAFLERGIVAAGLVVEAALVEVFLATFRWLALGAGLLIIGGIFYFLQLERERLDKQ